MQKKNEISEENVVQLIHSHRIFEDNSTRIIEKFHHNRFLSKWNGVMEIKWNEAKKRKHQK